MITLYVKTHNKTGMKYFGKTQKKDPFKYKGSGIYWRNHLRKHGTDIHTEILATFGDDEVDKCQQFALEYSRDNNIVLSNEWANLQEENGIDGVVSGYVLAKNKITGEYVMVTQQEFGVNNILVGVNKGISLSEERKKQIRKQTEGKNNPFYGKHHSEETLNILRKPKTEEHKNNLRKPKSKKPIRTKEHNAKIGKSHLGLSHTQQTKDILANHFSKQWEVTFPDGHKEFIINLNKFCRDNGLYYGSIYKTITGESKHCKGYKVNKISSTISEIQSWFSSLKTNNPYKYILINEYQNSSNNISDKKYHWNKYNQCKNQNIKLFMIYENEWKNRQKQVKNFIKGSLGIYEHKIYARNCSILTTTKKDKRISDFLEDNHIQGTPRGWIKAIALFHAGEIVGVMTFSKHHRQNVEDCYVLSRLCWRDGYTIIGGSKRLFSYRPKDKKIVSWSDNRWSTFGGVYERLGFNMEIDYDPSYDYSNDQGEFRSKQSMKKSSIGATKYQTEEEKCIELGFYRIWDCGKKRWTYEPERI